MIKSWLVLKVGSLAYSIRVRIRRDILRNITGILSNWQCCFPGILTATQQHSTSFWPNSTALAYAHTSINKYDALVDLSCTPQAHPASFVAAGRENVCEQWNERQIYIMCSEILEAWSKRSSISLLALWSGFSRSNIWRKEGNGKKNIRSEEKKWDKEREKEKEEEKETGNNVGRKEQRKIIKKKTRKKSKRNRKETFCR